jgi:tetratricopeptide (TPR) repeat protein
VCIPAPADGEFALDFSKIKKLLNTGQPENALQHIQSVEKSENLTTNDQLTLKLLTSIALNKQGNFKKALQLAESVKTESKNENNSLLMIDACIVIAEALEHLGRFDEKIEDIKVCENELKTLEDVESKDFNLRHSSILDQQGRIHWWKGELDKALVFFRQSLRLREELQNEYLIAESFTNIGATFWLQGDITHALVNFELSLTLNKKHKNPSGIASSLNNIGAIYWQKGELDEALDCYQQSLTLFEEQANNQDIAISLGNIGKIYHDKGEFDLALEHHHRSLILRADIENAQQIAMSLFELISVTLDKGSLDLAQEYLQNLRQINKQEKKKIISQQYRVARALVLKKGGGTRERGKAEILLEQVAEEDVCHYQLTVTALLNLCELLLMEFRESNDQEILNEVQLLSTRLFEVGKEQNSQKVMAEVFLLKSKLALLELKIKEARKFLTQAQRIAEKWGLNRLAMKISREHDKLLRQLNQWEEAIHRNASLRERIALSQLEEMIGGMVQTSKVKLPTHRPEKPIMLLIVGKSGLSLFSQIFSETDINDQLLGGFLSAINSFGSEVFENTETLDRIMYQDHTLALKPLESLMFTYIFKGESYSALQKLDKFTGTVQSSTIAWTGLTRTLETGKTLNNSEERTIVDIATEIFLVSSAS